MQCGRDGRGAKPRRMTARSLRMESAIGPPALKFGGNSAAARASGCCRQDRRVPLPTGWDRRRPMPSSPLPRGRKALRPESARKSTASSDVPSLPRGRTQFAIFLTAGRASAEATFPRERGHPSRCSTGVRSRASRAPGDRNVGHGHDSQLRPQQRRDFLSALYY
jgi:hypothetical protein